MSIVAAVTGFSVLAAVAALWFDRYDPSAEARLADLRLAEVSSAMHGVSELQRKTFAQLTEVRSDMAALRDAAASGMANGASSEPAATGAATSGAATTGAAPAGTVAAQAVSATGHEAAVAPESPPRSEVAGMIAPAAAAADRPVLAKSGGEAAPGRTVPPATPTPAGIAGTTQVASVETGPLNRPGPAVETAPAAEITREAPVRVGSVTSPTVAEPRKVPDPAPIQARVAEAPPPVATEPAPAPVWHPIRPRVYREVRVYRPVRRVRYYIPSPPMVLAQMAADVRRNLYAIFH